jgi:hypothetical protein
MNIKINYTKEGGRYYRAQLFFYVSVAICALPIFLMLLVGLLNPLWFRDSYLHWLQNTVENFSRWRNFKMYGIYLGMNPDVWHALKDEDNKKNS